MPSYGVSDRLHRGSAVELFIVRHAQSTNNALNDPQKRECDPPLTGLGHQQAERLARYLAVGPSPYTWEADRFQKCGFGITRLYCSPMWRALQTARPLGEALGLTPEVWVELHEQGGVYLDHGADGLIGYPGRTRQEIAAGFPGYHLPAGITDRGWWFQPGFETTAAFHSRVQQVAEQILDWAALDERILLVSHGCFLDALLKKLFNQPLDSGIYYHHLNTAVSWLGFRRGQLDVEYLNRVDHLPPEMRS